MTGDLRRISVVLFEGFELLDVFGPAELFSLVPDRLAIEFTGPGAGPVPSSQGVQVTAAIGYDTAAAPGIMLIPGGQGTRRLVTDQAFLSWLRAWATPASVVTSVCTESAVLAAAGLLDGYRATSNKAAFEWVRAQSGKVDWIAQARWVQHRDRWTSSGVAAGMDMAAALLADLFGKDVAQRATTRAELEVHEDASWGPIRQDLRSHRISSAPRVSRAPSGRAASGVAVGWPPGCLVSPSVSPNASECDRV